MQIKVINKSLNPLPEYSTKYSAGMDVRANIVDYDTISLAPSERALVSTGLYLEIPLGYECQVRPRSGLAVKHGVTVLNSPGTIDADYRGEIKVCLINRGNDTFEIHHGDRIAQLVFAKVEQATFVNVDKLDDTERGDGGFGHTGVK